MEEVKSKINYILKNNLVRENEDFILTVMPELQAMVDFDQNHPHHHLDVWNHTLLTLDNLETDDLEVNMAALLHDMGKPYSYQDDTVRHFKYHADVSTNMAFLLLQRLMYDAAFIEDVCYLIETHDKLIDPDSMDNESNLVNKRLMLQYADAKAHHPNHVAKRLKVLDKIKEKMDNKVKSR